MYRQALLLVTLISINHLILETNGAAYNKRVNSKVKKTMRSDDAAVKDLNRKLSEMAKTQLNEQNQPIKEMQTLKNQAEGNFKAVNSWAWLQEKRAMKVSCDEELETLQTLHERFVEEITQIRKNVDGALLEMDKNLMEGFYKRQRALTKMQEEVKLCDGETKHDCMKEISTNSRHLQEEHKKSIGEAKAELKKWEKEYKKSLEKAKQDLLVEMKKAETRCDKTGKKVLASTESGTVAHVEGPTSPTEATMTPVA